LRHQDCILGQKYHTYQACIPSGLAIWGTICSHMKQNWDMRVVKIGALGRYIAVLKSVGHPIKGFSISFLSIL
jgi:hypothetical protein